MVRRFLRPLYAIYLRARHPHGVPTIINGERFLVRHDCRWLGKREAGRTTRVYEPDLWSALSRAVRATDVVVDVGANVGVHTVLLARRVTEGSVVAYEPDPRNAAALRSHVHMNGVADRVEVVEAAAGSEDGSVLFAAAGSEMSSIGNVWSASGQRLEPVAQ